MANEAVIGRTAVRVWPDTRKFREVLQSQLRAIAATTKLSVDVEPDFQDFERQVARRLATMQAILKRSPLNIRVDLDTAESERILRTRFRDQTIRADVDLNLDEQRRQQIMARLREIAKDSVSHVRVELDHTRLAVVKRQLATAVGDATQNVWIRINEGSLGRARETIRRLTSNAAFNLRMEVDRTSFAQTSLKIAAATRDRWVTARMRWSLPHMQEAQRQLGELVKSRVGSVVTKVRTNMDGASLARAREQLAVLSRIRTVPIIPIVKAAGMPALRQLTDLVGRISQVGAWKSFATTFQGFLDVRKIMRFNAGLLGAAGAMNGLINMTGGILNFGAALGKSLGVIPLLPGAFAGLAVAATTFKWALADANKQVPLLSENWKHLQESVKEGFWLEARDDMQVLARDFIPRMESGWASLGSSAGQAFSESLRGFMASWTQGSMDRMFASIGGGLVEASKGAYSFSEAMRVLLEHGTSYLPRLGASFAEFSGRFERWIKTAKGDGTLDRWAEDGIVAIRGLADSFVGVFRILSGLQNASNVGTTMQDIADDLNHLADVINSSAVQQRLEGVFTAVRDGWNNLKAEAGPGLTDMFRGLSDSIKSIGPDSGSTIGKLVGAAGKLFGSAGVQDGLVVMFGALNRAATLLFPILQQFEEPLNMLFTTLGRLAEGAVPVFVEGLANIANAFNQPDGLVDTFIQILPMVIDTISQLAVALAEVVNDPAVQSGLVELFKGLSAGLLAIAPALPSLGPALATILPQLGDFAAKLGPAIAGILPSVADGLVQVVDMFIKLGEFLMGPAFPLVQLLAENLGVVVAVMAGFSVLSTILPLIAGLGAIMGAIASPLGIAVVAVLALAGAFAYFWTTSEDFREGVTNMVNTVIEWIKKLVDFLKGVGGDIAGFFEAIPGAIKGGAGWVGDKALGAARGTMDFLSKPLEKPAQMYLDNKNAQGAAGGTTINQTIYNPQAEPGSRSGIREADKASILGGF